MRSQLVQGIREQIASGLINNNLTSCSKWATVRRIMAGEHPGPYSFDKYPWAREISDTLTPYTTVMKAAQMGVTECAINRAFYTIDILKRDVLYVLPTALNAGDFSKTRFNTALHYSPYLAELFTDTNSITVKIASGVSLYIRGSRGDKNLKSIPVSVLILDEVDEFNEDQIWLALERLSGHDEKWVYAISTPTLPNHGVHKLFQLGSQEHWYFKCPHCGKATELIWPESFELVGETLTDPRITESYIKCKECKAKLNHKDKKLFLSDGYWQPTMGSGNQGHRSFYINQLYSFTEDPGRIAEAFLRGQNDKAAEIQFFNSKIGIPYVPEGSQLDDLQIENCISNYFKRDTKLDAGCSGWRTMGIDVGDLNHIVIMDWTVNKNSRDINTHAKAKLIFEGTVLRHEFDRFDHLMREWQINHCVIDADPEVNCARQFARRFPGYVTLCRYRSGVTEKEISLKEDELGTCFATVDRTAWFDVITDRFKKVNRLELPRDISRRFKDHIKSVVRTYEKDANNNPVARYVNVGADHYAHAMCYAEIALPLAASYSENQNVKAFL